MMPDYKSPPTQAPATCQEVFEGIVKRQVSALMFHDRMADLFRFLGLSGFSLIHEYQYLDESIGHRKLCRYCLDHHNRLLGVDPPVVPEVIPEDWVNYTRFEVNPPVRGQAIERAFDLYWNWECETKELYCQYAKLVLDGGNVSDFNQINQLVREVEEELEYLDELALTLKSISYDIVQVMAMQPEIAELYGEKLQNLNLII